MSAPDPGDSVMGVRCWQIKSHEARRDSLDNTLRCTLTCHTLAPSSWCPPRGLPSINLTFKPRLSGSTVQLSSQPGQPASPPLSPAIRNPVGAAAIPVQALSPLDDPDVLDTQDPPTFADRGLNCVLQVATYPVCVCVHTIRQPGCCTMAHVKTPTAAASL